MDHLIEWFLGFYGPTHYFLVFGILLLCGLGLPIPEDITLIAAGTLVYYGVSNLWVMMVVGLVGVMIGDCAMYWIGAKLGRRATSSWFFSKVLPPKTLDAVSNMFRTRGLKLLFAARFMPGLRAPIFFSAGLLKIPFWQFFYRDGLAALISVPAIIGGVYYWGDNINAVFRFVRKTEYGILTIVIVMIAVWVGKALWKRKSRGKTRE